MAIDETVSGELIESSGLCIFRPSPDIKISEEDAAKIRRLFEWREDSARNHYDADRTLRLADETSRRLRRDY